MSDEIKRDIIFGFSEKGGEQSRVTNVRTIDQPKAAH